MKRLGLIDLSAVYWARWHSSAAQGDIAAPFLETVTKVHNLAAGFDYVVACTDEGRGFRFDILPSYKANRGEKDEPSKEQLRKVKARLADDGFHVIGADGFEADDVIATFVRWARSQPEPIEVTICGCDKDLFQLLGDGVEMRSTMTGNVIDAAGVVAKLGVNPSQVRDYLALVGDASDNVPGVRGVGPKGAAALLGRYGDLPQIIGAAERGDDFIKPAIRDAILTASRASGEGRAPLDVACRVLSLRDDAPIDCAVCLTKREPKPISGRLAVPDDMNADPWSDQMHTNDKTEITDAVTESQSDPAPAPLPPPHGPSVITTAPRDAAAAPAALAKVEPDAKPTNAEIILPSDPRWTVAMEPASLSQAMNVSKALFQSRLFSQYGTPEAVFAVILTGRSMGIDAMTSLRNVHIIEGKPSLSAQMIVSLVLRSGLAEFFELLESDDEHAVYETKRKGGRREIKMGFSIRDAERAGLIKPKGNWEKYPRTMLRHRAAVELARTVYPDVCSNIYTPDELGDDRAVIDAREVA